MICRPCRLAADIQTELQDKVSKKRWLDVQATAKALHKNCQKCDCQHHEVGGGYVQREYSSLDVGSLQGINTEPLSESP